MQFLDKSIGVFDIGSVASGYQALNAVCQEDKIHVVDASVLDAERFIILLQGEVEVVKAAAVEVRRVCETFSNDLSLDLEIVESPHPSLLPSMYSLTQSPLGESLVVVETDTVSALVAASQTLLHGHGLSALEIKPGRGMRGKGFGVFTGMASQVAAGAEDVRTRLKAAVRNGRIEVIDQLAPSFKEFFEIKTP